MAQTKQETAAALKGIEQLKADHKVSDAVFEGMKAANGWKTGKQVTEAEFTKACENFCKAPVDGRKEKKEAKG